MQTVKCLGRRDGSKGLAQPTVVVTTDTRACALPFWITACYKVSTLRWNTAEQAVIPALLESLMTISRQAAVSL